MSNSRYMGFGLARLKVEGAPVHPDDMTWEHYGEECAACARRYQKQLEACLKWEKEFDANYKTNKKARRRVI